MARDFQTTRWSVVLRAREGGDDAIDALGQLCTIYWQPLFAFARRQGHASEQAHDLTQEFCVRLLEGRYAKNVERERGRFRSFLLGCFKHFLQHEWRKGQARKRGGEAIVIPLEVARELEAPSSSLSPDQAYDRQWALTMLEQVLLELEERYRRRGKEEVFRALAPALAVADGSYEPRRVARELGMTEGAIKVAAHRLRRQYRDALRRHIADTLDDDVPTDGEMELLLSAL